MRIRPERATDIDAVRTVNLAAFDTRVEADLVEALREQASPIVSLVAEDVTGVVGHILFSPVTLLPHADVVRLPDAGHWPHEEAPDNVIRAIQAFLER